MTDVVTCFMRGLDGSQHKSLNFQDEVEVKRPIDVDDDDDGDGDDGELGDDVQDCLADLANPGGGAQHGKDYNQDSKWAGNKG